MSFTSRTGICPHRRANVGDWCCQSAERAWQIVYTNEVDLTPWRGAKWVSVILLILVIAIYVFFAS